MVPYLTTDRTIRGLIAEFTKTTPPERTLEVAAVPPLAQQVLSTLPEPIMLINGQLQLVWANRAFFETFAVGPAALGQPLADAWEKEPSEIWGFLGELVAGRPVSNLHVARPFGRPAERKMRLTGRVVPAEDGRPLLTVVLFRDE